MKLLFVIFVVWLYCIISNAYWLINAHRLYKRFLSGKEMSSYIPEVDELFSKADTTYNTYYNENKGGYLQRSLSPVAYLCDKKKYFGEVNKVFLVTIGMFRMRLKHSIFPIHFVFLPSYILRAKGRKVPSIIKMVLNFLYWIITSVAVYHLNTFLDFVYKSYLQSIFERIL